MIVNSRRGRKRVKIRYIKSFAKELTIGGEIERLTAELDKLRSDVIDGIADKVADKLGRRCIVAHGHWTNDDGYEVCSCCHELSDCQYKYCPYCGAKMDGGGTNA